MRDVHQLATGTETIIVDLGVARSSLELFGHMGISPIPVYYWIQVAVYDGAGSTVGTTDLTGDYLSFDANPGTQGRKKIPLSTLARPDGHLAWAGRRSGPLYLTSALQGTKRLVLVVGTGTE